MRVSWSVLELFPGSTQVRWRGAFTGDQLDFRGLSDIEKLDQFTPNLVLIKSPTYSNVTNAAVYIRGIGQNDFTPVIDPGVGIYIDGVYLGRSIGAVLDIVDVERIEILRGPQGTLFGRNTIGGAGCRPMTWK